MIELLHLHKSYKSTLALSDVSLVIPEAEIFGIIGKSGAGKSTLLRCLNLLESPDSGQVIIDGQDLTTLNAAELRQARHKTAMIFQHFNLLNSKTVYDNIALAMRIQGYVDHEIDLKIKELLALVELSDKANAYPSELSGGQKQRVAIARALSTSPKILLCDEATSALDPETTESILALLQKINQSYGLTIVLITHEMDVVKRICHRLAVMEHGRVLEVLALNQIFIDANSRARALMFAHLSPKLPNCLTQTLSQIPSHKPLLRILFEGEGATAPFISQTSRDLQLDINILLANLDRFDGVTCGVLVVELNADAQLLNRFIKRAQSANLTVEVLAYVHDAVL